MFTGCRGLQISEDNHHPDYSAYKPRCELLQKISIPTLQVDGLKLFIWTLFGPTQTFVMKAKNWVNRSRPLLVLISTDKLYIDVSLEG